MNLSDRIQHELTALLAAGQPLSFRLTLSGIAKHFCVSPMPVRTAVVQMIKQGLLIKHGNGRLEVDYDHLPSPEELAETTPGLDETQEIDRRIADEVVMRSLTHDEHYLREAATAERYGIGRTVVRRVFSRLSGQGLIDHVPRCGWLVRPYREKDMLDYLEIRETLELKALSLARDRMEPAMLDELRQANDPGDRRHGPRLDNRLHQYWIDLADNRYISDFFAGNAAYYAAIFDYAALDPGAKAAMARQHCEILDSLLCGDHQQARRALVRHIRAQQPNVVKLIDQATADQH